MNNLTEDLPMGLGMALAQNLEAMRYFSSLPTERRQQIINHTRTISSKAQMQAYIDSLIH